MSRQHVLLFGSPFGLAAVAVALCDLRPAPTRAEGTVRGVEADKAWPRDVKNDELNRPWLPNMGFGISLGGGGVSYPQSLRDQEAISSPAGLTLGFDFSFFRFLVADFGFGRMSAGATPSSRTPPAP